MAQQVQVNASARFQCHGEGGKFYYQTKSFSFAVDSAPDSSVYYQDALQYLLSSDLIPGNCENYGITVDSVESLGDLGPGPDSSGNVTIYFYVWCVDTQGNMLGHEYTQRLDIAVTDDVDAAVAQAAAEWYDSAIEDYCQDAFSYDYRVISPAYFQYSSGG